MPDDLTIADARKAFKAAVNSDLDESTAATALAAKHEGLFYYVGGHGWYAWDEPIFVAPGDHLVHNAVAQYAATDVSDAIEYGLSLSQTDEGVDKDVMAAVNKLSAWKKYLRSQRGVEQVAKRWASIDTVFLNPNDDNFDPDPNLLNTTNGVLDLLNFELIDPDPKYKMTCLSQASYNPNAATGQFARDMERYIPDPETRAYLQRFAGWALTGHRLETVLYVTGRGGNYKSTFIAALALALGTYYKQGDADMIVKKHRDVGVGDKQSIASTRGKRLVSMPEVEAGKPMSEQTLKVLTEDTITARLMYKNEFTFENRASYIMSANGELTVNGADAAVRRRLSMVGFDVEIPDNERDTNYAKEVLALEAEHILWWCIEGLKDVRRRGNKLDPPAAVKAKTDDYMKSSDIVAQWIDDQCDITGSDSDFIRTVSGEPAYDAFVKYAESVKGFVLPPRPWAKRLEGFDGVKRARKTTPKTGRTAVAVLTGIRLRNEEPAI